MKVADGRTGKGTEGKTKDQERMIVKRTDGVTDGRKEGEKEGKERRKIKKA